MKIFFSFIFLINSFALSQTTDDSVFYLDSFPHQNFFTNSFNTQLNTFYLANKLKYNFIGENYYFRFDEEFNSTLVKSTDKSIKDEQEFQFISGVKISPMIDAGIIGKSSILSDSRKIEINAASINNGLAFVKVVPFNNFFFTSKGGLSDNRQIGSRDFGSTYGLETGYNYNSQNDLMIKTIANAINEDISPRKNYNRNVRLFLDNDFGVEISNSLQANFNQFRKDFYYHADSVTQSEFNITNNILGRIETQYNLENNFHYRGILEHLDFSLFGLVNFREIKKSTRYKSLSLNSSNLFDTKVDELRFDAASTLDYKGESVVSSLQLLYQQRDEKYGSEFYEGANILFYNQSTERENQKNNLTERITLASNSVIHISQANELELNLSHNKLKYDTPNENNFDDRDELLSIVRIKFLHKFNSLLSLYLQTEGNLGRLVYISAQKSSNNFINRVLKFASGVSVHSTSFFSHNIFEVTANYTVFDYEDLNPNFRSYSFRQFGFIDSTSINLTDRISLKLNGYVRISEQAELNWNSFTIKPMRFLEEIFFTPYLQTNRNRFQFAFGLRNFSLKTFFYTGENRNIQSYYSSIGPFTSIGYESNGQILLSLSGWREFINSGRSDENRLTTFSMNILWKF